MSRRESPGDAHRLRILQSFRGPRPTTNPYLVELLQAIHTGADVRTFSWRAALLDRYDVLHVHWPDVMLRGSNRWRTAARQLAFALLMARLRLTRSALVRTMHNTAPHERGGPLEAALLRLCDRNTTLQIRLNAEVPSPLSAPAEVILLAHYGGWFRGRTVPASIPGRLLYFGLVRPYKGVPELLDAFQGMTDPAVGLRVVGSCDDETLSRRIACGIGHDHRMTADLRYVDDDRLAQEIGEAELVVLPYLAMGNSGALLTSLSLDRPVLVPASPVTRSLAEEVGQGWVITYEGQLATEHLASALERVRSMDRASSPDLHRRDWSVLGPQHLAAYARAVALAKGRTAHPTSPS
jgi:beta-1,4-mannosyltransferase